MRNKIVIIGAGAIGKAIGRVLSEKQGNKIAFWDMFPGKVRGQKPLSAIIPKADVVFLCIPSWGVSDAIRGLRPHLKKRSVVVSLSKGTGIGQTADQTLAAGLPKGQPFALLFGSTLAEELGRKAGGCAVAAGTAKATSVVERSFRKTSLAVIATTDIRGVALAGVLKNIYAMGLGMAAAQKAGHNLLGAYVARAHEEMERMIAALGGRKGTASGPAGLGDLVTTGFSRSSKNWQTGYDLAKTGRCCRESEGSRAVGLFAKMLGKDLRRYPLFLSIWRIIKEKAPAKGIMDGVCRCR